MKLIEVMMSNAGPETQITDLPQEVLSYLFSFLPPQQVPEIATTCRLFSISANDTLLWSSFMERLPKVMRSTRQGTQSKKAFLENVMAKFAPLFAEAAHFQRLAKNSLFYDNARAKFQEFIGDDPAIHAVLEKIAGFQVSQIQRDLQQWHDKFSGQNYWAFTLKQALNFAKDDWDQLVNGAIALQELMAQINDRLLSYAWLKALNDPQKRLMLTGAQLTRVDPAFIEINQDALAEVSNCSLAGNPDLPPATLAALLAAMPNCRVLNLSNNNLSSVPPEVWSMTRLEELDLSHNRLTKISEKIGKLAHLVDLRLNHNRIGNFPLALGGRPFSVLKVDHNPIQFLLDDLSRQLNLLGENRVTLVQPALDYNNGFRLLPGTPTTTPGLIAHLMVNMSIASVKALCQMRLRRIFDNAEALSTITQFTNARARAYHAGYQAATWSGFASSVFAGSAYLNHAEFDVGYHDGMNGLTFTEQTLENGDYAITRIRKRKKIEMDDSKRAFKKQKRD